jgi:YD repeat-containing protein
MAGEGPFVGRLKQSVLSRIENGVSRPVSTTNYAYAKGVASDLSELMEALEAHATPATLNELWPNYAGAWIEFQRRETIEPPQTSVLEGYLDAMGNTVAMKREDGSWSFTLFDAMNRPILSITREGSKTRNTFNAAGLLVRSVETDPEGNNDETTYEYDEAMRLVKKLHNGKLELGRDFSASSGERQLTTTAGDGSRFTQVRDAAGRVVREIHRSPDGKEQAAKYGYDEHGRRNYERSPTGLETWRTFDPPGREIETRTLVEGRASVIRRGFDRYGRLLWTQTPLQAQAGSYTTYLILP